MPQHLIPIAQKIKDLETRLYTCPWDQVAFIQTRIAAYQAKLAQGLTHEPDF